METIKKVSIINIPGQIKVNKILRDCGKDLYLKEGLTHWKNSFLKNAIIVFLCSMKNQMYLVKKEKEWIATYQYRKKGDLLYIEKLAVTPHMEGKGIGKQCLTGIEDRAKSLGCKKVCLDVYEKNQRAVKFYVNNGYFFVKKNATRNYKVVVLEKVL